MIAIGAAIVQSNQTMTARIAITSMTYPWLRRPAARAAKRRAKPLGGGYGEPPERVVDLEAWARQALECDLGSPN